MTGRAVCDGVPCCVRRYLVCGERGGGVDVHWLRCGSGLHFASASMWDWARLRLRSPAAGLDAVLLSSLPLLHLGLPRRPQKRAGWARDEGGGARNQTPVHVRTWSNMFVNRTTASLGT